MDVAERTRLAKLREENPALERPDWLPVTDWEELEDLRTEHGRLLAQTAALAQEAGALEERFKEEDEARSEALRESFRSGGETTAPEVTPEEERKAAFAEIKERQVAAVEALDDFLNTAVERIQEHAEEWDRDLGSKGAEAEGRAAELRAAAARAEAEAKSLPRLGRWLTRTAENRPGMHIPAAMLVSPVVPTVLELANNGLIGEPSETEEVV